MNRKKGNRVNRGLKKKQELTFADREVTFVAPDIIWQLEASNPHLFSRITRSVPWVKRVCEHFLSRFPVARTCRGVFKSQHYFRLIRSNRKFFMLGPTKDVLGIKGTEVLADDLPEMISHLKNYPTSGDYVRSFLDSLVFNSVAPMTVTLTEVNHAVNVATTFHSAFFERYKELARLPLPLLACRWPQEVSEKLLRLLRPFLSPSAFDAARRGLEGGIGAYIYYYPNIPYLVAPDLMTLLDRDGDLLPPQRFSKLRSFVDPALTIESWIQLTARMLGLGFSPVTLHYPGTQSLGAHNASIDGGFDTVSMQPLSAIRDRMEFDRTMVNLMMDLGRTVKLFLTQDSGVINPGSVMSVSYVQRALFQTIRDETRKGVRFDARIASLVNKQESFENLIRLSSVT